MRTSRSFYTQTLLLLLNTAGYRVERFHKRFDISKHQSFDIPKYRTCFALHPLVSPCVLSYTRMQILNESFDV